MNVFSPVGPTLLHSFLAYDQSFTGGVFVAGGDVNNDGFDDIITGAGAGGTPEVKAFNAATQQALVSFLAFDSMFMGGVRVAAGDFNNDGKADFIVGAGPGMGPEVRVFDSNGTTLLHSFFAYDQNFLGGVFVGFFGQETFTVAPTEAGH